MTAPDLSFLESIRVRNRAGNQNSKDEIASIRTWVDKRLKKPDGTWINDRDPLGTGGSDVMFCILEVMGSREPGSPEYIFLVDTAMEFLEVNPSVDEMKELVQRLQSDLRTQHAIHAH